MQAEITSIMFLAPWGGGANTSDTHLKKNKNERRFINGKKNIFFLVLLHQISYVTTQKRVLKVIHFRLSGPHLESQCPGFLCFFSVFFVHHVSLSMCSPATASMFYFLFVCVCTLFHECALIRVQRDRKERREMLGVTEC